MRTQLSVLAFALALCLCSYLALGWGPLFFNQGFEAAITE